MLDDYKAISEDKLLVTLKKIIENIVEESLNLFLKEYPEGILAAIPGKDMDVKRFGVEQILETIPEGINGGSVAKILLAHSVGEFTLRGITNNRKTMILAYFKFHLKLNLMDCMKVF